MEEACWDGFVVGEGFSLSPTGAKWVGAAIAAPGGK